MNWDQVKGEWTQMKGSVRKQWGKLTDDDLDVIAGERERLVGKIQERYGIAKEEAEKQIANWSPPSGAEVSRAKRDKDLQRKAG
ncbi:MAG TPA: CsbD family protein [Terriglobales bacterium]|nr:CsbD family protein [Terriglobales bacterium]